MNYELTLKKEGYKESEIRDESIFTKLKKMAHENLFFFGIFLTAPRERQNESLTMHAASIVGGSGDARPPRNLMCRL